MGRDYRECSRLPGHCPSADFLICTAVRGGNPLADNAFDASLVKSDAPIEANSVPPSPRGLSATARLNRSMLREACAGIRGISTSHSASFPVSASIRGISTSHSVSFSVSASIRGISTSHSASFPVSAGIRGNFSE
ncbi:hypothetical protein D3C73_935630 [compost metagenome]